METTYRVVRRSVDARQRAIKVNLTLLQDDQGKFIPRTAPIPLYDEPHFRDVQGRPEVYIIGAGPAGLFAALTLIEHGLRPIIFERGKEVSARKRDIAALNRNLGLNPESNYCFGAGGAGTFSDGKLFSRSKKRGNMQRVMELFHYFGARDTVLYEAHAHIGSDRLPAIITRIQDCIREHGGEIHYEHPIHSLHDLPEGRPVILAIGHSAHDTYRMLYDEGVAMEAKGCAIGVRVEHPQSLINQLMYHSNDPALIECLGNASYSLVSQVEGRGVYSFCMCPGGHIVPAASEPGMGIVNGMSTSNRNSPFANSGIVVELHPEGTAMDALAFQEEVERLSYRQVNTDFTTAYAPAQRLKDFVLGRESKSLPDCSYLPGIRASRLDEWLPREIGPYLREGFRSFDRKYPGFVTNDAVILGVESRSSSPIRIIRDAATMQSISHPWLYPVAEGSGYAGGITSSALDGINAALALTQSLNSKL